MRCLYINLNHSDDPLQIVGLFYQKEGTQYLKFVDVYAKQVDKPNLVRHFIELKNHANENG